MHDSLVKEDSRYVVIWRPRLVQFMNDETDDGVVLHEAL